MAWPSEECNSTRSKSDNICLEQYSNLRYHFSKLVIDILGESYYNNGMDVYGCDEQTCLDLASELRPKSYSLFSLFERKEPGPKVDKRLFGTYIVVYADADKSYLEAVKDWLEEVTELEKDSIPSALSFVNTACIDKKYITIDFHGRVECYKDGSPPKKYREVKLKTSSHTRISGYTIKDNTVEVFGTKYNADELKEALKGLESI